MTDNARAVGEYATPAECVRAFLDRRWPLRAPVDRDMELDLIQQLRFFGWSITPLPKALVPTPHDCSRCGTPDEKCNEEVRKRGRSCCKQCHLTDTHGALT